MKIGILKMENDTTTVNLICSKYFGMYFTTKRNMHLVNKEEDKPQESTVRAL